MSTKDQPTTANEIRLHIGRKLEAAAIEIRDFRARELQKSTGLSKSELCPLCGNADRPGSCTCPTMKKASDKPTAADIKADVMEPSLEYTKEGKAKPVKKDEMSTGNVTTAPEKARKGTVLPGTKPSKKIPAEGSGGEITKKSEKLQKDAARSMVGLDPWKKPGSMGAPKLPGMTSTKVNGMHPDTAASLAALKQPIAAAPAAAAPAPLAAAKETPSVDAAAAPAKASPGASAADDAANLKADKKAGGVGFLNSLISRFKGIGSKAWGQVSGGVRQGPGIAAGMAALHRSEDMDKMDVSAIAHGIGEAASLAGPHIKAAALAVKDKFGGKGKPFGKNEFGTCLHCKKDEHGGLCKDEMGTAPPEQTGGLSSINHNVIMKLHPSLRRA